MSEMLINYWYMWVLLIAFMVAPTIWKIVKPKLKGIEGEQIVRIKLSSLDKDKFVILNDVLLMTGQGITTQIDHVVVSTYAVFVIETKNYAGCITGYENSKEWTQAIYKVKNKFQNPIRQNYGHMKALEHFLVPYGSLKQIPIIAFCSEADLKVKTETDVVTYGKLTTTIKKYCETEVISFENVLAIRDAIQAENIEGKQARANHVRVIKARS